MHSDDNTIYANGIPVAIIMRQETAVENLRFFTEPDNSLQVGLHHGTQGGKLEPHIHLMEKPIVVNEIQEVLMILSGSIRLTLYSDVGEKIDEQILHAHDGVLLLRGGHEIDFLEETQMFEVKQGPYPGVLKAKKYLKSKK